MPEQLKCPNCGEPLVKTAVSHNGTAIDISLFRDSPSINILTGKPTGGVTRHIDPHYKTWLNAHVCTDCGHIQFSVEHPQNLAKLFE